MAVLAALGALDAHLSCIVEQDMYPVRLRRAVPIALRTQRTFRAAG